MRVDIIDNIKTFNQIEKNWDAVYTADPDAHFFLSSTWLSGWLPMVAEPWLILAAKSDDPDSSYVAFFPLKYVLEEQEEGVFASQICMAGNSVADYTGLICIPGYEAEAISAFAAYVQEKLIWSTFDVQNFLKKDERMSLFLEHFSQDIFNFTQYRIQNQGEKTDHYLAPYLCLEDDWDRYLQNSVTSNTRQKIRRFLRKIESSDEFYITHVDSDNLESHIEILLGLWKLKWGEQKGENCDSILAYISNILRHCFEKNCLYFPVLWKGDKPLGAIANFIDRPQKSMLFVISGRDETCKNPPPGLILHADAIRYAIENGFRVYDFLRGNEEYKYSFGVKERQIEHLIARYKSKSSQSLKLDVITLPLAFHLTAQNHRKNRLAEAENGYRQILETQSNHSDSLYGLGVLMRQKGDYSAAENLMKALLQIQPNSIRALFSLGNLYQAQERLSEAIEAYQKILELQPNQIATYNNLGYALQQQGKWEEAIACYQKALERQPDCIEAEVNKANALHAQRKLSPEKQAHYAALNNDLGNKCQQAGDLKTALAYYQQSVSMNPDFAEAQYNLDRVLQKDDELKTAIVS